MSIPTKESILAYLADIKQELQGDGITELGLFGSYANSKRYRHYALHEQRVFTQVSRI